MINDNGDVLCWVPCLDLTDWCSIDDQFEWGVWVEFRLRSKCNYRTTSEIGSNRSPCLKNASGRTEMTKSFLGHDNPNRTWGEFPTNFSTQPAEQVHSSLLCWLPEDLMYWQLCLSFTYFHFFHDFYFRLSCSECDGWCHCAKTYIGDTSSPHTVVQIFYFWVIGITIAAELEPQSPIGR